MIGAERRSADLFDRSYVHTHAPIHPDIGCVRCGHSLYAQMGFASNVSAAPGCAAHIQEALPSCLLPSSFTYRNTASRSRRRSRDCLTQAAATTHIRLRLPSPSHAKLWTSHTPGAFPDRKVVVTMRRTLPSIVSRADAPRTLGT